MMHRMLHLIVMMTLSGTIGATWLHAQDYPDSKGRDFWFTFLPNFHNNADSLPNRPNEAREHRLYVFIGADSAATGTITTYDRQGVLKSTPFSITDPTKLFEWSDFYAPYELVGFQRGGRLDYTNNQCEVPTKLYFHITADVDVTVYALNQATFTSDAFLILPTDALGQDYVVMSYPSSISGQPNSSTPSEFVITATEDDTDIEIIPTAPTVRNVQDTQRIVLQQGESYLVQVDTRDETFGDLTGTSIVASRPIAVFSGHQRTTIPMQNSQLSSRDCLVEQLNPVTTWGRRSFIAPFPRSSDEENVGNDIYRLVSRFDSTSITVNGVDAGMLMAGQVFEAPLLEAVDVRTTRPVLVAQFKKTSSTTSSGQLSNTGDPLMMLVPPSEEFLNSYTFINVQSRRIVQTNFGEFEDDVYKEQYATIVMPEPRGNGTSSADYFNLTLDGQPITPAVRQIGTSKWVYFTQRMTDGVHRISADTLIGLYVFGYGQAVSYGYIGGMSFRPLDVYPPAIDDTVQCSSGAVSITDTVIGDKGIDSVWFGARQNIADNGWRVIATPRERRETSISLGNPYMDGFIEILAIDVEEQIARKRIDIAGFTVAPLTHNGQGAPMARTWVLARKRQRCDTVIFENYGSFPRTITNVRFASGAPVNIAVPFTLAPGETFEVTTCRQFDSVVTQLDTIFVEDACRVRAAVAYEIEVQNDKLFPRVSTDVDPCSTQVNISIREDDPSDFGLEYVRVVDSLTRNCTVVITGEMPKRQDIAITVIDPYDDALYYVEALDSAGNEQIVADTIYGFTLEVAGVRGAIRSAAPASVYLGDVACVELPIHNYGLGRITIDRASMSENLRFSLPPGQFPISLAPGDSGTLTVCYEPVGSDTTGDVDSLVLQQQCLDIRLNVDGKGLPLALDGISRCNLPVEVTVLAAASAAPLPASDLVTIGLPIEFTAASVRLIDMAGTNVGRFDLPAGTPTRALRIGVGTIAEGVYVALVEAHGMVFSTLVVIRR